MQSCYCCVKADCLFVTVLSSWYKSHVFVCDASVHHSCMIALCCLHGINKSISLMQTMAHQGGNDASDSSSKEESVEWSSYISGPPPSSDSEVDVSSGPNALRPYNPYGPCHCDTLLWCSFYGSFFEPDTHCPMC